MENISIPHIDELIEVFDLFDDWEDRYRYLIDLGRKLPDMPEDVKTDATKVEGCTSQVWMERLPTDDNTIDFLADSDAHIVRGLIGVLFAIFHGRATTEAPDIDVEAYFKQLGLEAHLSPNRRNGFFSMVGRLREIA